MGLPEHLQTESGSPSQGARPTAEKAHTNPAGAPQTDPWDMPAPYTGDNKEILDWEHAPLSDQP
jgi:hypothetical protein